MTDYPFVRRGGRRIRYIGTKGGAVKASSGFAFQRIQRESADIAASLARHGDPFHVEPRSRRYQLFDSVMLQVMSRHGGELERIFGDLFTRNRIDRVLGFLDETGSVAENVQLMATLPAWPFLRALVQLKVLRRI